MNCFKEKDKPFIMCDGKGWCINRSKLRRHSILEYVHLNIRK